MVDYDPVVIGLATWPLFLSEQQAETHRPGHNRLVVPPLPIQSATVWPIQMQGLVFVFRPSAQFHLLDLVNLGPNPECGLH